jgi:ubiquitin-conjugating enzyme E2 R
MSEYKSLEKEKWVNIEVCGRFRDLDSLYSGISLTTLQLKDGGLFNWTVGLMVVNSDSYYDGGYFKVGGLIARLEDRN